MSNLGRLIVIPSEYYGWRFTVSTAKRYNLNDIMLGAVREMQPISHDEILFEIGELSTIHPMPSQQEINLSLEEMEKKEF